MAVELPFVRFGYQPDRSRHNRGFYYMMPIYGPRVIVAEAFRRRNGAWFYKGFAKFVRDYGQMLGIGGNLLWTSRPELNDWLDGMLHNSFMRCSVPGVLYCWYHKHISAADLHGPLVLPDGFARDFQSTDTAIWVLVKHGPRSWPIRIVDNVMQSGWVDFRNAHNFKTNYRLILVCERKWIFTAVILDQNGKQVWNNWTQIVNTYWITSYVPRGNLRTAFALSEIEDEYPLANSGYEFNHTINHQEEFERRIELSLYNRYAEDIVIRMNPRTWAIPLLNGHLETHAFSDFVAELQLQENDFIFVSVSPAGQVRVVVFDAWQRKERLFNWF